MMHIIEFFEDPNHEKWIDEIEICNWSAAKYLAKLLKENSFGQTLGNNGKLFLLLDKDELVSFITLTRQDCIADEKLFPWLGFLFTSPKHRGKRYAEKMIKYACSSAKEDGHSCVYLATDHVGLYEKYGFSYKENRIDIGGEDSRIYHKEL